MANASPKKIVIVRKKKAHGGGHHGGSWKVAYADFVTAMMAFFMVMWILGMDENMKKAIEGYFANPVGYKKGYSSGSSPVGSGSNPGKVQQQTLRLVVRNYEEKRFQHVERGIRLRLDSARALSGFGAQVEVVMEKNGLRIELIETREGETCFPSGSAAMKPVAAIALDLIAAELSQLSNPVIIEGHTDAAPFGMSASYTNWELSADRANAARRVLQAAGMSPRRIVEVRGMADRQLRAPDDPLSPTNRRISLFLPFTELPGGRADESGGTGTTKA